MLNIIYRGDGKAFFLSVAGERRPPLGAHSCRHWVFRYLESYERPGWSEMRFDPCHSLAC